MMKESAITVIGGGTMGREIAFVAAMSGFQTYLVDVEQRFLDNARQQLEKSTKRLIERDRMSQEAVDTGFKNLEFTIDRDVAVNEDLIAQQLSDHPKQIFEHQAAVDSLVDKLAPFATQLRTSDQPFVLSLPNVYHLATDVSAELTSETSILDLVAEINPTAAVGGTPRQPAMDAIWQLEAETHGMDRGLYAGAVGWLDAHGQGEFGIALRGSLIEDAHHVRVYAGGGIVDGSDPAAELAETHAKMRPMKKALRVQAF